MFCNPLSLKSLEDDACGRAASIHSSGQLSLFGLSKVGVCVSYGKNIRQGEVLRNRKAKLVARSKKVVIAQHRQTVTASREPSRGWANQRRRPSAVLGWPARAISRLRTSAWAPCEKRWPTAWAFGFAFGRWEHRVGWEVLAEGGFSNRQSPIGQRPRPTANWHRKL